MRPIRFLSFFASITSKIYQVHKCLFLPAMTNVTSITTVQHLFHIFVDNPWNRKRVLTNATSDSSFLCHEIKKTDFTEKSYFFLYVFECLIVHIYTYVNSYTSLFNHLPFFNILYRLIYYFIFYYDCSHYFFSSNIIIDTQNRHTVSNKFLKNRPKNLYILHNSFY